MTPPAPPQARSERSSNIDRVGAVLLWAARRDAGWAAARLAGLGVPVFPCAPGAKRPLTRHGFLDATADVGQVRAWWRRWPGANLGVPTGPVSGLDVVDVDVRAGGDGRDALRRAAGQADLTGWAFQVLTPSGGVHLFYPADPDKVQPSWACGATHVDFRGAGGYIIAPPSTVEMPGRGLAGYRLVQVRAQAHPVDADQLRAVLDPGRAQRRTVLPPQQISPNPDVSQLAGWVSGLAEGERNRGLFWAACRMAETGHSFQDTVDCLTDAARQAGLPDREIHTTIASAHRRANSTPTVMSLNSARCVVEAVTL